MAIDTSGNPYYDDFDRDKKFVKILARPGRPLQAREITQSQSILLDIVKKLSDTILEDGNIVSGMGFSITDNVLSVGDGLVYLEGIIHKFSSQSITITKQGVENIGVKLEHSIVSANQDESLRDPAIGFKNYNAVGADRLKLDVVLTLNDPSASTIYSFEDGNLLNDTVKPELDIVTDQLARRTYDESGNYKVRGLTLYTEPKDSDSLWLVVDPGKAYILGYEINKSTSVRVAIPRSKDIRLIQNESNYFTNGTYRYKLGNSPVRDITRVQAEVLVTRERISRGSIVGGLDYLSKTSVSRIERVWQENPNGSVAWEYVPTSDFQLTNSQAVSWAPSGAEPNIGETYYVTYRYNKAMVKGTDYTLTILNDEPYVDFTSNLGDDPIDNTQFFVDYEFYLARKDLVVMDRNGAISVVHGQPDLPRLVSTPSLADPNVLNLGTITALPNSENSIVNSYAVTRMDMADLQRLMKRVEDIEYNQAVNALDSLAESGESPTELKGIFSDGFFNLSKADVFHRDFNIALDLEVGNIVLPVSDADAKKLVPLGSSQVKSWGRLVSAPMTEEIGISQLLATQTMLVNPYNVFNKLGVLKLSPEIDNFINETVIEIEKQTTATYLVHRWWYHGGTLWDDTERYLYNNLVLDRGQSWDGWDEKTGTILSSSAKTILDESAQYMREIEVEVHATNLIGSSDNLRVVFDGNTVSATPLAGFSAGSEIGTLRANVNGEVKGKFRIPQNTRVGTKEVAIMNDYNTAIGSFTSNGRNRTVEKTVLTTRVTVNVYDPLAQSFQFESNRIISSVGLYFSVKDNASNLVVQIRNMVNGYPGAEIYGERVVTPDEVRVSTDASQETKVMFDDPIMCNGGTQYCVVVITDSDKYSMFVAELGKANISNGVAVTRQPYTNGVLFSSSNAITWTAHQTMDLTFKVYTATFADTGTIEFEPINNLGIDRLVLLSEYLTPENTGCEWQIRVLYEGETSLISTKPYLPIGNYEDTYLSATAKTVQLKATFKSNRYISPLLALDGISLVGFITALSGSYVSRNTIFPESASFTTVKQVFEAHVPSGCTVRPTFSTDGGATWINNDSVVPLVEQIDDNFSRFTFVTQVPNGTPAVNFRAKLTMTSSNSFVRPRARKFMNICK